MDKRSWMVSESICKEIIWISQIYWKFWTIVSKLSVHHPLELKWMTRVQRKSPFLLSACLAWGCVCVEIPPARAVICPKAGIGATTVGPASWGGGGGSRNMEHMRCSGCHRSAFCTNSLNSILGVKGKSPGRSGIVRGSLNRIVTRSLLAQFWDPLNLLTQLLGTPPLTSESTAQLVVPGRTY